MVLQRRHPDPPDQPPAPPRLLEGPAPDGSPIRRDLSRGTWIVLFMTSSCRPCRQIWDELEPGRPDVVVVTPSPSTENRRRVAALAPSGIPVVMSSEAWFAFRPGPAPWQVVVVDGVVTQSGPATPGARSQ